MDPEPTAGSLSSCCSRLAPRRLCPPRFGWGILGRFRLLGTVYDVLGRFRLCLVCFSKLLRRPPGPALTRAGTRGLTTTWSRSRVSPRTPRAREARPGDTAGEACAASNWMADRRAGSKATVGYEIE